MMNTTANTKFNDRVLFKVKVRLITFQFFFTQEKLFCNFKADTWNAQSAHSLYV